MTDPYRRLHQLKRATRAIDTLLENDKTPEHELTPAQLDERYNPEGNGEHPRFPRGAWRDEVFNDHTLLGYWEWVSHQLNDEFIHADPN